MTPNSPTQSTPPTPQNVSHDNWWWVVAGDGGQWVVAEDGSHDWCRRWKRVLMITAVKEEENGVIQLYSSEQNPRDSSSLPELDQILVEPGPGMETKRTTAAAGQIQDKAVAIAWCLINRLGNCLEYPRTWLEETRCMLMILATMISTTTFQAAVDPPGGVWQDNNTNSSTGVAGSGFPKDFLEFVTFNTVSFIASLSVTLLLVGGFPLRNRVIMWLLSMAMCLTLTSMALTYVLAIILVFPATEIFTSYENISLIRIACDHSCNPHHSCYHLVGEEVLGQVQA
ncbi:hypothetical protein ACE6H2_011003 [Prunus campanulata]